jgi:hypothetical protein
MDLAHFLHKGTLDQDIEWYINDFWIKYFFNDFLRILAEVVKKDAEKLVKKCKIVGLIQMAIALVKYNSQKK